MSGYIGPSPVPQSIQRRQSFTATAGQTTFGTTGYTDGDFIDVYLNGVKLVGGTDYTATNGTDIVLTSAASASDVLDFVTFNSFQLVDQTFTGQIEFDDGTAAAPSITNTGDVNTGIFFPASDSIGFAEGGSEIARIASNGFFIGKGGQDTSLTGQEFRSDDQVAFTRDGGHPLLLNRKTSDGDIALFQKDQTTVGKIGTGAVGGTLFIDGNSSGVGLQFAGSNIYPRDAGSLSDGGVDLGQTNYRFKDLYLSGGVYLGGTGSANKLDDVEEGTFTLSPLAMYSGPSTSGFSSLTGAYRKVNDKVTCVISFDFNDSGTNLALDHRWTLEGLPFAPVLSNIYGAGTWWCYGAISSGNNAFGHIGIANTDAIYFYVTHVDGTLHYSNAIKAVFTYLV